MNISEYLAKDKEDKQQEIPPRLKTKETNLALSIVSHCMWYSLWSITHHIVRISRKVCGNVLHSAEKPWQRLLYQQRYKCRWRIHLCILVHWMYGWMFVCGLPHVLAGGTVCVCLYVEKHVVIVCINWSPLFCKTMKYLEFHSHSSMQSDRIGGRRYMQRVSGG